MLYHQPIIVPEVTELVDARVTPEGTLGVLSQVEVNKLLDASQNGQYELFRRCALAVLNCGSQIDNSKIIFEQFRDFDIRVIQQDRGIKLEIRNAPASAFVDGKIIKGIKEHVFAVLRDIVYVANEIEGKVISGQGPSHTTTNAIFHILRNAGILKSERDPNLVVCWGGHAIDRLEYDYTKEVGHEMGLRGIDICTGCGPGAMKGPMKGAAIGHAKQRIYTGRYIGVTEPGIVAAESPNPIVNDLVIMPDIEKRLETFVRIGHGIVVFPGGVGTAEEILFLLGVLLHPKNADIPFPLVLSGPKESEDYFREIDALIGSTLGAQAQNRYRIILDDPVRVAREMVDGVSSVREHRKERADAYYFNWSLHVPAEFQRPFTPTHDAMAALELHKGMKNHALAANLRRAFSGIVAGNVKVDGIRAIEEHGPFEIRGTSEIMRQLDRVLSAFVEQKRMRIDGTGYQPCYRLVS